MYTAFILIGILFIVAGYMGKREEKRRERFEDYTLDWFEREELRRKRERRKSRGPKNRRE